MSFRITYRQDGKAIGKYDRAVTMYDARKTAYRARETHRFNSAIILAPMASGDEKEIEVIHFDC